MQLVLANMRGLVGLLLASAILLASPIANAQGPLVWNYRCIDTDDISAQVMLYRTACAIVANDKDFRSSFIRPALAQDPACACAGGVDAKLPPSPPCDTGEEVWACSLVAPPSNSSVSCGFCDPPSSD